MDKEYKTISEPAHASFTEKKSEFIGSIAPCTTEAEAVDFIEQIRKQHRKASHNCYAYILRDNNISRHSDDGEPGGTAGTPIYEVLKKEGLTDVCCVVTRYFGGILLGAGGLVRAYTNGAKLAVDSAEIKEIKSARRFRITLEYSLYGKIGALLTEYDARVQSEEFAADACLTLCLRESQSAAFKEKLVDICFGRVKVEDLGVEEFDFA
ncbi:MAG: YigZ family protein [Firmicutes bacterium]|nr:YigZ family protein [[Eubacterium] siraeum]MCM1486993.1 YigZ family protein [Bacillota bacterium]